MKSTITKPDSLQPVGEPAVHLFDNWFDPIEAAVRDRVRRFIETMIEDELDEILQRPRYRRHRQSSDGNRDGLVAGHARPSIAVTAGEASAG